MPTSKTVIIKLKEYKTNIIQKEKFPKDQAESLYKNYSNQVSIDQRQLLFRTGGN